MKKSIAMKWVAALRSGEYKQTKWVLKNAEGYCCLGVLCKVMGKRFTPSTSGNGMKACLGKIAVLPSKVVEESGMRTCEGYLNTEQSLVDLNDSGETFSEIADIIEKEWKKL